MNRMLALLGLAAGLALHSAASAADCNRDCLKKHLDGYLEGLTGHQPEAAGLWIGFRQTENAVAIPEGEGLWRHATALGSIQRRYFDPVQGQAGYFGTLKLGDEEAVVALRLRVQWNSYFDGITSHDGRLVKGHPGCTRYENGFPTFNTPMKPENDIGNNGRTDCRTQADFGVAIVGIRDFYVIDEEAQAVMVSAVFRREARNAKRRNHFTELFHVDHGRIRDIHAAFHYAPEDRPVPNWPPYDGLFPLPASYR